MITWRMQCQDLIAPPFDFGRSMNRLAKIQAVTMTLKWTDTREWVFQCHGRGYHEVGRNPRVLDRRLLPAVLRVTIIPCAKRYGTHCLRVIQSWLDLDELGAHPGWLFHRVTCPCAYSPLINVATFNTGCWSPAMSKDRFR
jgi:hypothetical protein